MLHMHLIMMEVNDTPYLTFWMIMKLCCTWWSWWWRWCCTWWWNDGDDAAHDGGNAAPDDDDVTTYIHDHDHDEWWRWMMHLMMIMEWSDSYGYSEMHGIEVFNKVLLIRVVMVIYLGLVLRRWRCTWWCTWWWWWEVMSKEASPRVKKKKVPLSTWWDVGEWCTIPYDNGVMLCRWWMEVMLYLMMMEVMLHLWWWVGSITKI